MKAISTNPFLALAAAISVSSATSALADTGTWTSVATTGNWDDIANWSSGAGPIADGGAGFTAYFVSNITAATTVTLATPRSVQNIIFSDNNASGSAWTLVGSSITLETAGPTPKITTTTGATISTVLAGANGLSKDGANTLTLSGDNTYDGNTTISTGALNVRHANALGTATAGTAVVSGAALQIQNNITTAEPLTLNGSGISNAGALTSISGTNYHTGTIKLNTASRINASAGTLNLSGNIDNGVYQMTVGGSGTVILSSPLIPGAGGLTKDGTGTLALDYTFNTSKLSDTGTLNLGGGTLSLVGGSHTEEVGSTTLTALAATTISRASGTSVIDLKAITLGNGAMLNLATDGIAKTSNANNSSGLLPYAITVGGVDFATRDANGFITAFTGYTGVNRLGGFINDDPSAVVSIVDGGTTGNITLAAGTTTINSLANKATGGVATIDLTAGITLRLGADSTIFQPSTATGALTIAAGGTLTAGGAANTPGIIKLTNNNPTVANRLIVNATVTDNGSGSVAVTKTGAGQVDLGSASTFTGALSTYGGSLNLTGAALTYAVGSLVGTGNIVLGGNTLVTGADNTSTTYSGALSGTNGAFTKTGTGTQTLSGATTYTGETIVNSGTLLLNSASGTLAGTSKITVNDGGIMEFGGASTTNNSSGRDSIGTNSKQIIVKSGGMLKSSTYNPMGYNNLNNYANIILDGGTFNIASEWAYLGSVTLNTGGTVIGNGAMAFWYATAATGLFANADATIASKIQINDANQTFTVADTSTLTISGNIGNWNNSTGGVTAGKGGFIKAGMGTLSLTGSNNYGGATTISAGTVKLGSAASLGAVASGTSVTAGATLDLNGQTLGAEPLTLNGTGISSSGALINSNTTPAAVGAGAIVIASATSIGGPGNIALGGAISGTAALTKTGSGTVALGGDNISFTGPVAVSQGSLVLTRGVPNSTVSLADGATLGADNIESGTTLGDTTFGVATGSSFAITNFQSNTTAPVLAVKDLKVNGATTVNVSGSFAPGTYTLISATSRSGTGTFTLVPLRRGVTGTLSDSGSVLTLDVTAVNSTIWKGTSGSAWDVNITPNWKLGAADPDVYKNGDAVVFDNTATNTNVVLNTTVTPLSLIFDFNAPKTYAITGTGGIAGSTDLWKKGDGTLTLSTSNTFTGATVIDGGTLRIGGAGTLGGGSYAATIDIFGDALHFSSSANQTLTGVISGTGTLVKDTDPASTLTLTAANTYSGNTSILAGTLQLGGAGIIGGGNYAGDITLEGTLRCSSSSSQTLSGILSGAGSLIKDGAPSVLTLGGDNSFAGGTLIQAGGLKLDHENALGTGTVTMATTGNSQLNLAALTGAVVFDNKIDLVNPAAAGNLGLVAPSGAGNTLELSGLISGGGANSTLRLINGTGLVTSDIQYIISGSNTYAGKTYFYEGGVRINHANAFGTSTVQFDQSANTPVTFGSAMTVGNAVRYTYQTKNLATAGFDVELSGTQSFEIATAFNKTGLGKLVMTGICSGTGGLRVTEGALRLTAFNTYTGSTLVSSGALELADDARITFKIGSASGAGNTLSGDGTVTLDGDFAIDTTAAAALSTGIWVLENVSTLTGPYGATFTVVNPDGSPWANAGDEKWTKPGTVSGTQWIFDEVTGTLTLVAGGYDAWKTQIADAAQQGRDKDPDGDGFTNLQEFLFGTLPTTSNGTLVTSTPTGGNLILRWLQRDSGATYSLKHSSTLGAGSWATPASPVPALDSVQTGAPADYKYHTVTIPIGSGNDFFRIEGLEN